MLSLASFLCLSPTLLWISCFASLETDPFSGPGNGTRFQGQSVVSGPTCLGVWGCSVAAMPNGKKDVHVDLTHMYVAAMPQGKNDVRVDLTHMYVAARPEGKRMV